MTTEIERRLREAGHSLNEAVGKRLSLQCPTAYDHDPDQDGDCAICGWSPDPPAPPRIDPELWEGIKAWITAINGVCPGPAHEE